MTKTKRIIAFILLITILASLIFIGKVANIEAKKNSNTKKKITMTVGQKKTIKLNKNVKIKWKTSNKKVVSVSKKGVIKAKKVGKAKVTAKLPNKKVQYTVKVNKKPDNKTPEPTKRPPMTYAADVIIDHIEKIDDEYSYVYGVPNEEKTGAFGVAKIGSNGIDMLKIITKNSQIDRLKASAGDYVIYICSYGVEKKTEGNILLVLVMDTDLPTTKDLYLPQNLQAILRLLLHLGLLVTPGYYLVWISKPFPQLQKILQVRFHMENMNRL